VHFDSNQTEGNRAREDQHVGNVRLAVKVAKFAAPYSLEIERSGFAQDALGEHLGLAGGLGIGEDNDP
jgi:hypothetical protein